MSEDINDVTTTTVNIARYLLGLEHCSISQIYRIIEKATQILIRKRNAYLDTLRAPTNKETETTPPPPVTPPIPSAAPLPVRFDVAQLRRRTAAAAKAASAVNLGETPTSVLDEWILEALEQHDIPIYFDSCILDIKEQHGEDLTVQGSPDGSNAKI